MKKKVNKLQVANHLIKVEKKENYKKNIPKTQKKENIKKTFNLSIIAPQLFNLEKDQPETKINLNLDLYQLEYGCLL